jgi:NTP pyrophosphatase (non-canonical NTP hydrolase)
MMDWNYTFHDYEWDVAKYRLPTAETDYVILGLIGEIGELYGKWAKSIRDETKMDALDVKKELGDVLWFLTMLCRDLGTSLGEVANINEAKLAKRMAKGTIQGSGDER